MDSEDVFPHFSALHDLVRLIYQGSAKFVLLSTVDDSSWKVHLGLSGQEGRWWSGQWTADSILKIAGNKCSPASLETFARRLADTIVQGELAVGNWSPDKDAEINLTLGPASKKPLTVPLVDLAPQEAASHATAVFISLAFEAQGRKCKLNPSSFDITSLGPPRTRSRATPEPLKPSTSSIDSSPIQAAQDEIKSLKAQLAASQYKSSLKRGTSPTPEPTNIPKKGPRPKGASLANPNKKARKYQGLEFASDDE